MFQKAVKSFRRNQIVSEAIKNIFSKNQIIASGLYHHATPQLHALGKSFCKATMANLLLQDAQRFDQSSGCLI
jgi:hypothetical protein